MQPENAAKYSKLSNHNSSQQKWSRLPDLIAEHPHHSSIKGNDLQMFVFSDRDISGAAYTP